MSLLKGADMHVIHIGCFGTNNAFSIEPERDDDILRVSSWILEQGWRVLNLAAFYSEIQVVDTEPETWDVLLLSTFGKSKGLIFIEFKEPAKALHFKLVWC